MNVFYAPEFKQALKLCSREIKRKLYKQVDNLVEDLRYPSLHAKKYDEERDIWQARVDRNYRFYFYIDGDAYVLLDICAHPK